MLIRNWQRSDTEAWHFNLLQKVKHGRTQHEATFSWCHIAHEIEFRWDLNTRFDIKYGKRVKMKATIAPRSKATTRGHSTEQQENELELKGERSALPDASKCSTVQSGSSLVPSQRA